MARKREDRAAKVYSHKKDEKSNNKCSKLSEDEQNFILFNNHLALMGLALREVPGDGNCLFRALGDQMEGHTRKHLQYRQQTVEHMRQHRKDFEPFIEDNIPFDCYVNNLEKPGTSAGNDAIVAFARLHGVTVVIHQLNSPLWKVEGAEPEKSARELHIAYHNGDHYNSIRRIGDASESPADVKLDSDISSLPSSDPEQYYDGFYKDPYDGMPEEAEDDLVRLVMTRSGCQDRTMAEQTLEDCGFDVELTVEFLINVMLLSHEKDDQKADSSSYISKTSHPLWGPNGTGSRLFGSDADVITKGTTVSSGGVKQKFPKSSSNTTTQPKKHLSNKQRKELKRQERKLNGELRKKSSASPEENLDLDYFNSSLVQKLACVNI